MNCNSSPGIEPIFLYSYDPPSPSRVSEYDPPFPEDLLSPHCERSFDHFASIVKEPQISTEQKNSTEDQFTELEIIEELNEIENEQPEHIIHNIVSNDISIEPSLVMRTICSIEEVSEDSSQHTPCSPEGSVTNLSETFLNSEKESETNTNNPNCADSQLDPSIHVDTTTDSLESSFTDKQETNSTCDVASLSITEEKHVSDPSRHISCSPEQSLLPALSETIFITEVDVNTTQSVTLCTSTQQLHSDTSNKEKEVVKEPDTVSIHLNEERSASNLNENMSISPETTILSNQHKEFSISEEHNETSSNNSNPLSPSITSQDNLTIHSDIVDDKETVKEYVSLSSKPTDERTSDHSDQNKFSVTEISDNINLSSDFSLSKNEKEANSAEMIGSLTPNCSRAQPFSSSDTMNTHNSLKQFLMNEIENVNGTNNSFSHSSEDQEVQNMFCRSITSTSFTSSPVPTESCTITPLSFDHNTPSTTNPTCTPLPSPELFFAYESSPSTPSTVTHVEIKSPSVETPNKDLINLSLIVPEYDLKAVHLKNSNVSQLSKLFESKKDTPIIKEAETREEVKTNLDIHTETHFQKIFDKQDTFISLDIECPKIASIIVPDPTLAKENISIEACEKKITPPLPPPRTTSLPPQIPEYPSDDLINDEAPPIPDSPIEDCDTGIPEPPPRQYILIPLNSNLLSPLPPIIKTPLPPVVPPRSTSLSRTSSPMLSKPTTPIQTPNKVCLNEQNCFWFPPNIYSPCPEEIQFRTLTPVIEEAPMCSSPIETDEKDQTTVCKTPQSDDIIDFVNQETNNAIPPIPIRSSISPSLYMDSSYKKLKTSESFLKASDCALPSSTLESHSKIHEISFEQNNFKVKTSVDTNDTPLPSPEEEIRKVVANAKAWNWMSSCSNLIAIYAQVRPAIQQGSQCGGIASLSMASQVCPSSVSVEDLSTSAKENCPTGRGELIDVHSLTSLANSMLDGVEATVKRDFFNDPLQLVDTLLEGDLVLVPYDPDKSHLPGQFKGRKTSWALVCGCIVQADTSVPLTEDQFLKPDRQLDRLWHYRPRIGALDSLSRPVSATPLTDHSSRCSTRCATPNQRPHFFQGDWGSRLSSVVVLWRQGKNRNLFASPLEHLFISNQQLLSNPAFEMEAFEDSFCSKVVVLHKVKRGLSDLLCAFQESNSVFG